MKEDCAQFNRGMNAVILYFIQPILLYFIGIVTVSLLLTWVVRHPGHILVGLGLIAVIVLFGDE